MELARNGYSAPNPHVGCVIVKNGELVGQGASDPAGGPHAEIKALAKAGEEARGATVYVTLEPCNHTGRTGPCSHALMAAGVSRVVVGVKDPNPLAEGGGAYLEAGGVQVEFGVMEDEAREVHHEFLFAMAHKRPWVRVKAAVTLDGKTAWPDGESKWITGPEAREDGHRYRARSGCVLVGRRTVEFDDPRLTARIEGVGKQPLRVVLDPSAKLSGDEALFQQDGETAWLVDPDHISDGRQTAMESMEPAAILAELTGRGQTGVLIEGGAATIRRFFEAELVDELILYVAPKLFGDGLNWMGMGKAWSPDGKRLHLTDFGTLGGDFKLVYRCDWS